MQEGLRSGGLSTLAEPVGFQERYTYPGEDLLVAAAALESAGRGWTEADASRWVSLQTMYPTLLFLMTLFLSILISSFICLTEINSSANTRVGMVKGVSFHEYLSLYFSSCFIVLPPLLIVLLLGKFLFMLQIVPTNMVFIVLVLFLLSSVFMLMGIGLSYLIRKESVTLLVTTFLLVFFIFFSGFLQPVERMSQIAFPFASNSPARLALLAFNKLVFYQQDFTAIVPELIPLAVWFVGVGIAGFLIKSFRKSL